MSSQIWIMESSSGEVDDDERSILRCHSWAPRTMLELVEDPQLCSGCPDSQSVGAAAVAPTQCYQMYHNLCLMYITCSVLVLTTACTLDHTSGISYRRTSMWCLSAAWAKLWSTEAWAAATHRNWSNTVCKSSSSSGVERAPKLCGGCWEKSSNCWVVRPIIASSSVCICTLMLCNSDMYPGDWRYPLYFPSIQVQFEITSSSQTDSGGALYHQAYSAVVLHPQANSVMAS